MANSKTVEILTEIRETLRNNNKLLADIQERLEIDHSNLWKILALTIVGSFAIIGVKLAIP